jgi:hypothetical protein
MLGLVGVIAAVAFLITSAGAGASAIPKIDLSTKAGVAKYLKSIGVNPKGVVIQRGLRNYAGPSCPGARWHCTRSTRVFQIAATGGTNKFECSDISGTTSEGVSSSSTDPLSCEISQSTVNGDNIARCIEDEGTNPATESCVITQVNVNGDNKATVDQKIKQKDGATQVATQTSEVDQTNTAGKNDAKVSQSIDQDTHGADQDQTADQSSCVKQHGPLSSAFACGEVFDTGATGNDSSDVNQSVQQGEHAGNADVNLNQDSNMDGHVSQDTTGVAKNHNNQNEHQNAEGKNAFVNQSGPMHCCTEQGTNPGDKFDVDQHSDQHTNATDFFQQEEMVGTCLTTGRCQVDEHANQNGTNEHNSCDSSDCSIGIVCASGAGGEGGTFSDCTPCTPVFDEGGNVTGCSVGDFITASFSRSTARPAVRPQAVRLLQRSALLH